VDEGDSQIALMKKDPSLPFTVENTIVLPREKLNSSILGKRPMREEEGNEEWMTAYQYIEHQLFNHTDPNKKHIVEMLWKTIKNEIVQKVLDGTLRVSRGCDGNWYRLPMLMDDPYGFSFRLSYSIDGLNEASSLEEKLNFLYTIPNYRNEYNNKLLKKRIDEAGSFIVPHDLEEGVKQYQITEEDGLAKMDRKDLRHHCSCDNNPFGTFVRVEDGGPVTMCEYTALDCPFSMWDLWYERFQNRNIIF
jgi:hypothetical protein